jgi:hypothetical protein
MLRDRGNGQSLTTPAQLATALSAAIPPAPLPQLLAASAARPAAPRESRRPVAEHDYWSGQGHQNRPPQRSRPDRAGGRRLAAVRIRAGVVAVLVLLVMVGVVAAAFQLRKHPAPAAASKTTTTKPPAPAVTLLTPLSAQGFDAYNLTDTGDENTQSAANAIDGDPATAWTSQYYFSPVFGGLKPGSGLMLDMGKQVRLASVQIQFGPAAGADVRIEIGNTDVRDPATVRDLTTVATAADVGGARAFPVHSAATGRYVLIWFTRLPPSDGHYMAEIFNIVLRGSG